jgi:chromodomain-helicase-DNA-binding protein 7
VKAYQDELANQVFPNGGQLRDYQAEGVTWLISNLINRRSSILTDGKKKLAIDGECFMELLHLTLFLFVRVEMGLGKTLQTAAFVNLVATRLHRRGPFLIVAPLSTIQHWYREFTTWTDLNTIIYHGSQEDRSIIREHEMAFECDRPKNQLGFNQSYLRKCMPNARSSLEREWMVQVVITTPEMLVTDDYTELTAVPWEMIVVDEAHRLKNRDSKLVTNLRDERFDFRHALLLTGTPIQNNMTELWTLLNFIDPEEYDDMDSFLERYGDIKSKERIDELHESIRPYILRRLKEDVEKSVPPKEETLIEVELTVLQKQYYRALYEKNVQFLHRNKKKALDGPSLSNLAMQLRKCCNHPFLLRGVEEEIRQQEANASEKVSEGDFLVKASGKLVLLDKLLPRLKEDGHRVLIFSQFKIMLDILEDYLNVREMKFERIDGSITGHKRQMSIDRFQSPSADGREAPLVMLLSTRAGGVGINLTAADTCIIFDR